MSRWVITDIHGCYHSFKALLEEQLILKKTDELYLLGDYINKGPFSKQVLDYIMDLQEKNFRLFLLRGNHEQEVLNVLKGTTDLTTLIDKGGQTFFNNFGIQHPADIPDRYLHFFDSLGWFFSLEDYLLVHSGFDFSSENPYRISEKLLNIREYTVDVEKTAGRRVLHGHTPTNLTTILSSLKEKNQLDISLDAGCAYKDNPQQARLLAIDLDAWRWKVQENIDTSDNYAA